MARAVALPAPPLTHLLVAWGQGDAGALERLTPARQMRRVLINAARKHGNQKRGRWG